jgi:hypothetical protein
MAQGGLQIAAIAVHLQFHCNCDAIESSNLTKRSKRYFRLPCDCPSLRGYLGVGGGYLGDQWGPHRTPKTRPAPLLSKFGCVRLPELGL